MDRKLLDSFAELLHKQRKEYLDQFRRAEEDLESIAAERESELEEHAQEEQSARLLTRMDDRTPHAVQEIDAALQRLLKGTYGSCEPAEVPYRSPAFGRCRRPGTVQAAKRNARKRAGAYLKRQKLPQGARFPEI